MWICSLVFSVYITFIVNKELFYHQDFFYFLLTRSVISGTAWKAIHICCTNTIETNLLKKKYEKLDENYIFTNFKRENILVNIKGFMTQDCEFTKADVVSNVSVHTLPL